MVSSAATMTNHAIAYYYRWLDQDSLDINETQTKAEIELGSVTDYFLRKAKVIVEESR